MLTSNKIDYIIDLSINFGGSIMAKLLVIEAHPHIEDSMSVSVAEDFIRKYRSLHPSDDIEIRDLYAEKVPALNDLTMRAWKRQRGGQSLSSEEQKIIAEHNEWLNEFLEADKYVFVNPMYNFFLPAEMKQYVDIIAVPHKTFKYTDKGPVGLLQNKKALHIQTAGSVYHGTPLEEFDFGGAYLKLALKLFGVDNFIDLYIEGVDQFKEQRDTIKKKAMKDAEKIAETF